MPAVTYTPPFATYRYTLPFPPSVNCYWRRHGHRYFVSKQGTEFKKAVKQCVKHRPNTRRRLAITIKFQRGDEIEYDLGNFNKAVEDALQDAGVYQDDSQIDERHEYRLPVKKGKGACFVEIREIGYAKTTVKVV